MLTHHQPSPLPPYRDLHSRSGAGRLPLGSRHDGLPPLPAVLVPARIRAPAGLPLVSPHPIVAQDGRIPLRLGRSRVRGDAARTARPRVEVRAPPPVKWKSLKFDQRNSNIMSLVI